MLRPLFSKSLCVKFVSIALIATASNSMCADDGIFAVNAEPELLWKGGEFTEGVAARSDGLVFFSDIPSDPATAGRILVFNPATPVESVEWILEDVDLLLVMTVNPGFGGQSFIPAQLKKIERLRRMIDASGCAIELEVDGGVTPVTAPQCISAGATALVAGSAVFKGGPEAYAGNIRALKGV